MNVRTTRRAGLCAHLVLFSLLAAAAATSHAQSRFTACNKLVANRMGVSPTDLIGKTAADYPENSDGVRDVIAAKVLPETREGIAVLGSQAANKRPTNFDDVIILERVKK